MESRVVAAMIRIAESKKTRLSNTAYIILNLFHDNNSLRYELSRDELEKYEEIQTKPGTTPRKLTKEGVYLPTIVFVTKRIADVNNCELDYWRHSIPTLLAILVLNANDETAITPLLRTIISLFPDTKGADALGYTPYHLSLRRFGAEGDVWRDEPFLFEHIRNSNLPISVDHQNRFGQTALHLACIGDRIRSLKSLIKEHKADPNIQDKQGNTPLHLCVMHQHYQGANILLMHGALPSLWLLNQEGKTPLKLAVEEKHAEFLEALLQQQPKLHRTILNAATHAGEEKAVMFLLLKRKKWESLQAVQILKMMCNDGKTLTCSKELAELFIKQCKESRLFSRSFSCFSWPQPVRIKNGQVVLSSRKPVKSMPKRNFDLFENSPLMQAVEDSSRIGEVKQILKDEPDVYTKNNFGQTPLLIACICRNSEAITLLKEHKANPNVPDHAGFTPYHIASYTRNYDLLVQLLEFPDREIDTPNIHGDTPFLIACGNIPSRAPEMRVSLTDSQPFPFSGIFNTTKLLRKLIKNHASPTKTDLAGNNALHKALCYGTPKGVKYLTSHFPDLFWEKNSQGLIPIEAAISLLQPIGLKGEAKISTENDLIKIALENLLHGDLIAIEKKVRENQPHLSLGNLLVESNHEDLFRKLLNNVPKAATLYPETFPGLTPLHVAVYRGKQRLWVIEAYADAGANLDIKSQLKNTPAHLAAIEGNNRFLKLLKKQGAALDSVNVDKQTPLHLAASCGNTTTVLLLLDLGAPLASKDIDGRTPLFHAVVQGHTGCVDALLREGAKLFDIDYYGNTVLHLACHYGHGELIKTIIAREPKCLEVLNDDKRLPLHKMCIYGDLALVEYLMEKYNFDPLYYEWADITDATPLHLAARHGHSELVKYFINNRWGIIWNLDFDYSNILHAAAESGNAESVQAILSMFLKTIRTPEMSLVNQKNVRHQRPLHAAGKRKIGEINQQHILDIAIMLLETGAKLHAKDESGMTFMHLIARQGFTFVLGGIQNYYNGINVPIRTTLGNNLLSGHDHNVAYSKTTRYGNTVLHEACKEPHPEMIKMLVGHADLNKKNNEGLTPIMLLAKRGHYEMAKYLWNNKASITERDSRKANLVHLILENESLDEQGHSLFEDIIKDKPFLLVQQDRSRRTPFHVLAMNNHIDELEILLRHLPGDEKASYFWKKDGKGDTAMDLAGPTMRDLIAAYHPDQLGDLAHVGKMDKVRVFFKR